MLQRSSPVRCSHTRSAADRLWSHTHATRISIASGSRIGHGEIAWLNDAICTHRGSDQNHESPLPAGDNTHPHIHLALHMLSSRPCKKCSLHSRRRHIPTPDRLRGSSPAELGRSPCTAPCLSLSDRCSSFWSGQGDSLAARCSCMRFCCAERTRFLVRHTAVFGDSDPHWDRLLAVPVNLLPVRQRIHQAHDVACSHSARHSLCGRHTNGTQTDFVQKTVTV